MFFFEGSLFFDWYSAAVPKNREWLNSAVLSHYPHCLWEISKARNGYSFAEQLKNPAGEVVLTVMYGGATQGNNLHVFATGDKAQFFSEFIRKVCPEHFLVRADVAADFENDGAWLSMFSIGMAASVVHSLKTSYMGPAEQERAEFTEDGRTLYVGSRSSVSTMRFYEKGKKDFPDRPNYVRAEFEFKPKNKKARERYASASPEEILKATKLGRYFLSMFGVTTDIKPLPAGTVRAPSDFDKTFMHLKKQYSAFLRGALIDRYGCDANALMNDLLDTAI